jgi:hypothetical protein
MVPLDGPHDTVMTGSYHVAFVSGDVRRVGKIVFDGNAVILEDPLDSYSESFDYPDKIPIEDVESIKNVEITRFTKSTAIIGIGVAALLIYGIVTWSLSYG